MQISIPCVVSLTWRLHNTEGQLIDALSEATEFFVGSDDLLPKVQEVLIGQTAGFETTLHLEPEHAFGEYDASLVFFEARELFTGHLEPGMQFDGPPEGCTSPDLRTDCIYTLTEVYDSHVVFDGNHPLAGMALRLSLTVLGVRMASPEEIEQQSVGDTPLTVLATAPASPHLH